MTPDTLTYGTVLIIVAAFTSSLAAVLLLYSYVSRTDAFGRVTLGAAVVSTCSLVVAHSYLTYQFIVGDYTNAYVWQNSADYLSLLYRVTGAYANHEGSILLWATLTAVVATWTVYSSEFRGRGSKLVQSISLGIVAIFAMMLITQSPFTPIEVAFPDTPDGFVPPDGDGLNPLLIDPWMAIHPPITFAAYALLIVPFALGVTHFISLFRGEDSVFDEWLPSMVQWLRVSWLLLTAAIAFGGIWAYGVLGWGGFWSWDPVETAVLIPWLALTASLHSINRYAKTGEYPIFAPASAGLIFPLVVFATTVVRSGVFRSVHSFAAGGIGTGILFLLAVTGTAALALPFVYWFLEGGTERDERGDRSWLSRRTVYHGAVLAFGILAFISIWGLSFPVLRNAATGVEVSVGQDHYNLWSYPVVAVMLLAGGLYAILDVGRRRLAMQATAAVAVLTIIAAFITPSANWYLSSPNAHDPLVYRIVGNLSVLSIVPPAGFFAAAWTGRYVARVRGVPSRLFKLRETGIVLIHVGGAVLVVAVSFIYLFSSSASVAVIGVDEVGNDSEPVVEDVPESEYTVHVTNYDTVEEPTIEDAARSPSEVLRVDEDASLVRGEITETDTIEGTNVARLDDSTVWLASADGEASFEIGTDVIARGSVFENDDDDMSAFVYTDSQNMGTASDPPTDVHTPRVISHEIDVTVYNGDEQVAEGTIAEQEYQRSSMNTNDALIERGLTGDTYVVGTVNQAGATVTIDNYPLANQIWLGVALLLIGMAALTAADTRFRRR